ncbi:hypothetical protein A2U01_0095237, partial [Trifolium medium]|nr:hypothetical protein [Trifolium medium]
MRNLSEGMVAATVFSAVVVLAAVFSVVAVLPY